MKKIKYVPMEQYVASSHIRPEPAKKHLPDWYKNLNSYYTDKQKFEYLPNGDLNMTVKTCNPFFDTFSTGYYVFLENDVFVKQLGNGQVDFRWRRGGDAFISSHDSVQIAPEMIPAGYNTTVWKFRNEWGVELPEGYSALYVHPLNRLELPFYTYSGVVDHDSYTNATEFPFILKEGFEGTIPAGTPISQIIPFKRESWSSEALPYDAARSERTASKLVRHLRNSYKKLDWTRKDYN